MMNQNAQQIAELRGTLGKMELALSNISEAIVWVGKNGCIQWCNAAFDRLVGAPHILLLGKKIAEALPLEQGGGAIIEKVHPLMRALNERDQIAGAYEFNHQGKKTFLEITCQYVVISKTEYFALAVIRDSTSDQESEKYRLLNTAVMTAANAIVITDRNGCILWFNPAFTCLTGYEIDELYQEKFGRLKSGLNSTEIYSSLWETIISGQVWTGQLYNRRKDGTVYLEEQTITPVRNAKDEITHFIAVKVDVTERELIQEKLERLSMVASKTDNAVIITDKIGQIEWVNEGFTRITGYSLAEVEGRTPGSILQGELTDQKSARKMSKAIRDQKSCTVQIINYSKDGRSYWLNISITPIFDSKGNLDHFIAIESDISEQKKTEEELKAYRDTLEEMVDERTKALKAAQSQLVSNAIEAGRMQMAAVVLHNIGNAVTPMQTFVELMDNCLALQNLSYLEKCYQDLSGRKSDLTDYVTADPRGKQVFAYLGELIQSFHTQRTELTSILNQMTKAVDYISEALTLQQAYAPSVQENKEQVDINQLIDDALAMQLPALERRSIRIDRQLGQPLPLLIIDKNRLMQVVINLIKNAYEAIDAYTAAVEKVIRIRTYLEDDVVVFELTDSGVGISTSDREGLFEYGVSKKGSSGYGLNYCKLFAENNKGTISLTSPGKGCGATVSVRLPAGVQNE